MDVFMVLVKYKAVEMIYHCTHIGFVAVTLSGQNRLEIQLQKTAGMLIYFKSVHALLMTYE